MRWEPWMGIPSDGIPQAEEPEPTDPLLAVSELEERFNHLRDAHMSLSQCFQDLRQHSEEQEQHVEQLEAFRSNHQERLQWLEMHYGDMLSKQEQRVTDLEERLRSLCLVVNVLIEQAHNLAYDEGRIDGHQTVLVELIKRTRTLARQTGIVFTDVLEEKE